MLEEHEIFQGTNMTRKFRMTILFWALLISPQLISAQTRGTPGPPNAPAPPTTPAPATTPAPPKPTPPPQAPKKAAPPKVQPPLTLRQVIESLLTLKNSARVESLVAARGIQFHSSPAVLDILKDFGASPKLLAAISAAAPPDEPPPPKEVEPVNKVAGPLNVVCEPKDCLVIVDGYSGATKQNKTTVTGLKPGEVVVNVFADGFESANKKIRLEEGAPSEAAFRLKRTDLSRQQAASVSMLKSLAAVGGMDGIAELADVEGEGVVNWTDSAGKAQEWPMTFRKRIGNDLRITFKPKEGQCIASIVGSTVKQDCRGNLKGSGEKLAGQATSLFLSYQLQDVMQTLLNRTLIASETSDDHLESPGTRDAYSLTLDPAGLPADLIYKSDQGEAEKPIQVQYSNYMKLNKGRYPGRVAIGRVNADPVFVFMITNLRANAASTKE
jgi:hypothetical protein